MFAEAFLNGAQAENLKLTKVQKRWQVLELPSVIREFNCLIREYELWANMQVGSISKRLDQFLYSNS